MATAQFPTSIPSNISATANQTLAAASHFDSLHDKDRKEIVALATKIGTGSSTPATNQVLRGTGTNTSGWGQIAAGDITPGTATLLKIAEATGTGSSATMSFTSIPSTYRSLVLVYHGRTTDNSQAASVTMAFESSPTNIYSKQNLRAQGTSVSADEDIDVNYLLVGTVPGATVTAGCIGSGTIWLPEYANTSLYKTVIADSFVSLALTTTGFFVDNYFGMFRATAAIDRIYFTCSPGNWTTTSRATLYGVPA